MGAPTEEQAGIPFTEEVMADELPVNCRTTVIAEYDGTTDPQEHLSRFENAALLHRYTNGIKCRVFVTTFARAAQQWFNKLPSATIGKGRRITERLPIKVQHAALEVPSATQEVKASAFAQGLTDGDFFKSLAKKPATKFDVLLARAAKYINMEDVQASKREGRGEKRKENRDENPPKKSKMDFKDKKPAWPRVNMVYTPLTVPITEALMAVKARSTGLYQKYETDKGKEVKNSGPGSPAKDRPRISNMEKAEVNDPPRRGVIRMIVGSPASGDLQRARKTQVREAYGTTVKEIMDVEPVNDTPLIQFDQEEHSGPRIPGNDALVITALLANYEIERVFIDSGSSTDILFGEAYDQMRLGDAPSKQ
ncbi:UNVERIFIED_CONTAM: hypothetical protein Slati_0960200 [Sesamum latifolium]|uniref:Uncharacterized protein n=1 Tax=Sesamum latifolium TaxID=2727402 RepID=A0AAW2XWT7_9LAMI